MSQSNPAMDAYLVGLRNQHAVETQAIGTIQNQLGRMKPYPELHARMQADKGRSTTQAARLDELMAKHGTSKSVAKEAVSGTVATVAGFAHAGAGDSMLKDVLAAVGFKAYEVASYQVLLTLAEAAGAAGDTSVLRQSMQEEQEMGDWFDSHLADLVHAYVRQQAA
ncbi:DUF892 family protein [Lichenicoccus sp.]|uniref:DUF892 family protein n=1 Tax=Lichenicoccus sp. TaxID=2781899 RepID=UPI003D0F53D8